MKSLRKSTTSTAVKKISPLAKKTTPKLPQKTDSVANASLGIKLIISGKDALDMKKAKFYMDGDQFFIDIPGNWGLARGELKPSFPRPHIEILSGKDLIFDISISKK